jgi:hypothetical protein
MRTLAVTLLLFGASTGAAGQEVFGTLRASNGGDPVAGAIVIATRAADQSVLARTITGDRGTYSLRFAPDSVSLRVLRVGQRPYELGSLRVLEGERVERSASLPDAPVVIQTMTTRVSTRCRVRPEGSETVAQLFDEARKALDASRLISNDGAPTARYLLFTQSRSVRGAPIGLPQQVVRTTSSTSPFRSVAPESLSVAGYVTEEADQSTLYRAPDARVLLSDEFLSQHCLRLVDGPGDQPHLIGVEFEPAARSRDLVQVRGTLWMDRSTKELQRLEFVYVGLDPALMRANPGGTVEYTRLDNGVWFASYWEIRMPRYSMRAPRSTLNMQAAGPRREIVVEGVQVTGGEVLGITTRAGLLYTRGIPETSTLSVTDLSAEESACADASSSSSLAGVVGVVQNASRSAMQNATVRAEWKQDFRRVGNDQWVWQNRTLSTETDETGYYSLCSVPKQQLITLQSAYEERASRKVSVRVPQSRAQAVVNLSIPDR